METNTGTAPAEAVDTSVDAAEGEVTGTEGQDGQQETATQAAAKAALAKRKIKLKIDGQEIEEEYDPNDEEAIRRDRQLARAAEKRMSEARDKTKKAFEIIQAFEKDPETMLARLGPKGREIAEKYLLKQIQDEMLTPEQKQAREEKEELERYRKEKQTAAEKEAADELSKQENEYAQQFQNTIIDAVKKSGLPKSPELVKRMASLMAKNLDLGLDLTADDLVFEVKKDLTSMLKSVIGDADGEQLIEMFGPDVANKIRKSDLRKLQEGQMKVFGNTPKNDGGNRPPERPKRPQTIEEWRADVARRVNGK